MVDELGLSGRFFFFGSLYVKWEEGKMMIVGIVLGRDCYFCCF